MISVAISAAAEPDVSPNPMVLGPGGYGVGDYWKLGLPPLAFSGSSRYLLVPVYWSF